MAYEEFEGGLVPEAHRLRDMAISQRDEVLGRCTGSEKETQRLITEIAESQRRAAELRLRVQVAEENGASRDQVLEKRYQELLEQKDELHQVADMKSEQLVRSSWLSRQLDMSYAKLKRTHAEVLEENERAKEVLALERNVALYKEKKEKELKEWEARLQKAQLECEQRMQSLMITWESRSMKYGEEIRAMQAQYDELQSKYELKRSVAERELDYQVDLKLRAVEEAEREKSRKIADLSMELQQKSLELRTQILQNQRQVQEIAEDTRRKMQAQLGEIRSGYRRQVEQEKQEADEMVGLEREKVREAKEDYVAWKDRVRRLEQSYRGHTANTAVLVHCMDCGAI